MSGIDRNSLVNMGVILGGIVSIGLGVASSDVGMKVALTLLGIVAILGSLLGIVNGVLASLGIRIPTADESDQKKRKRRLCPKCLGRVKTVIAPDYSGFRYWCPSCNQVVPVPTTSKRLEKLREPGKRRTFDE